jgi:hypothetical protein
MPKYRQLHLKILDSEDVNEMPDDFTRLSWVFLSLIVDSEGRGMDNIAWIRSKMYPSREDVSLKRMGEAVNWYADHKMIVRYSAGGRKYFYIPTWHTYQTGTDREGKSSIPAPDLLPSDSGVAPEQLPSNQPMQAQCNSNAMQEQGALDPFISMRQMVERLTGYTGTQRDITPLNEFVKKGILEEDIQTAIAFLNSVGKTPRGAADLRGSVMTAFGKRTQSNHQPVSAGVPDADGNIWR